MSHDSTIGRLGMLASLVLVAWRSSQAGELDPPAGPVLPTPGPNAATILSAASTPGDADDRFIISAAGSYRTGGVQFAAGFPNFVRITSTNVDLDLDGFEIVGASGAQFGVVIDLPANAPAGTITIRNGGIKEFSKGIKIQTVPFDKTTVIRVVDMALIENDHGLQDPTMPHDGVLKLERVNASDNTFDGISAPFTPTTGTRITANRNDAGGNSAGLGVDVGSGSNLADVDASGNSFAGISIGGGSLRNVKANNNGHDGVRVGEFGDAVEIDGVEANGNTLGHGVNGKKDTRVRGGRCRGNKIGVKAGDVQGVDTGNNSEQNLKIISFGRVMDSSSEGAGTCGLELASGARAFNVSVEGGQTGVLMGDGAQLWQSAVTGATGNGIEATGWVLVDSVVSMGSGGHGIDMQSGFVRGSWAAMNMGNGVNGGDFVHVINTAADNNGVRGIAIGQGGEVSDCCTHTNGSGILVAGGSRVMGNLVAANGIGIEVNGSATVDGNTVTGNTDGIVVLSTGSASQITGNVIKSHVSGAGVQLQSTATIVLRNSFSGNLMDVQEQVSGNKVAPIQCDPATAGPHDNWAQ